MRRAIVTVGVLGALVACGSGSGGGGGNGGTNGAGGTAGIHRITVGGGCLVSGSRYLITHTCSSNCLLCPELGNSEVTVASSGNGFEDLNCTSTSGKDCHLTGTGCTFSVSGVTYTYSFSDTFTKNAENLYVGAGEITVSGGSCKGAAYTESLTP